MNVLDLFSGIGGFSLGLERAGMRTVAFCEISPFCRKILGKRWPDVPIYEDVRELTAERLREAGISVDLICGGFPCQDISIAGKGAGLEGERSGLWGEIVRLACELRPQFIIVENVGALTFRGLGRVLGDLAEMGMDAEWYCIPAAAVGAPHRRERIWIVAYADKLGRQGTPFGYESLRQLEYAPSPDFRVPELPEPAICRMDDGVPHRVDRLFALGNTVVPQIPELLGRAIMTLTSREGPRGQQLTPEQ
jgi:DNA (cytosine-5)-methyltransferase 1